MSDWLSFPWYWSLPLQAQADFVSSMNRWRFSQAISYRIAINVLVLRTCARFAMLMGPTNATTPTIDSIFQKSSVLFHVWCSFFMTCMIFFQKLYIAQRAACGPCWWMRFHFQLLLGRKRTVKWEGICMQPGRFQLQLHIDGRLVLPVKTTTLPKHGRHCGWLTCC